jgi:hypothetical protein
LRNRSILPYVEFAFGLYMSFCAVCSVVRFRAVLSAPFLVIFAFGFFYVSVMSFLGQRAYRPVGQAGRRTVGAKA